MSWPDDFIVPPAPRALPLVLWRFAGFAGAEIICLAVEHPIGVELRKELEVGT